MSADRSPHADAVAACATTLFLCAGMNAEVDEAAEERKGGSGHLGKMLLSAGNTKVNRLAA
jgi:hypothetical protein